MNLAKHYTHNISCGRETTIDGKIDAYVIECLDCQEDLLTQLEEDN